MRPRARACCPSRRSPAELALRALERARLSPLAEWHYRTAHRDSFVSIDRARAVLGWEPRLSNAETLCATYDWYLAHRATLGAAGHDPPRALGPAGARPAEAARVGAHPSVRLRSRHDREIVRLAIPALGALAAEPLYILVDTAIVGHLGRAQLAALGVAATALIVVGTFNFLQYGTTAQVARATGAGRGRDRPPARGAGAVALARARRRASRSWSRCSPGRSSR